MSDEGPKSPMFGESVFAVEEGATYRVLRTGAIWMNKLFFSSIALLVVWLFLGLVGAVEPGCTASYDVQEGGDVESEQCSVWLSTTAKYLGGMAVVSFLLSILSGLGGLVVGKKILEMTPRDDETGAKAIAEQENRDEHE